MFGELKSNNINEINRDTMKFIGSLLIVITFGIINISASSPDKLEHLRTQKKIVRMDKSVSPFFAIQITALTLPPGEPSFFNKIDVAREYPCTDGFVRYCVGQFIDDDSARNRLASIKSLGYHDAFIVDTRKYKLKTSKWGAQDAEEVDPNKIYTVQLSALRFPVYLSHFKELEDVMEFKMEDDVFRYTAGRFPGTIIRKEVIRIKSMGYKDAFLVELNRYLPFKIE